MSDDFFSFMGMKKVVLGPDGRPLDQVPTGANIGIIAPVGLAVALAIAPTAALPLSIQAMTGAKHAATATQPKLGIAERVAFCKQTLSLNITQLAEALQVERPTVYAWLSGSSKLHPSNELRLNLIYRVADSWLRTAHHTLDAAALLRPTNDGRTIFQMLKETDINVPEIRNVFAELQKTTNQSELSSGQKRFAISKSLGYEKLSKRDAARRLRVNLPI